MSAPRGPFEDRQEGRTQKRRAIWFGNVVESVGNNEWVVLYDNGHRQQEKSTQLSLHLATAGLQPVLPPSPAPATAPPPQNFGGGDPRPRPNVGQRPPQTLGRLVACQDPSDLLDRVVRELLTRRHHRQHQPQQLPSSLPNNWWRVHPPSRKCCKCLLSTLIRTMARISQKRNLTTTRR